MHSICTDVQGSGVSEPLVGQAAAHVMWSTPVSAAFAPPQHQQASASPHRPRFSRLLIRGFVYSICSISANEAGDHIEECSAWHQHEHRHRLLIYSHEREGTSVSPRRFTGGANEMRVSDNEVKFIAEVLMDVTASWLRTQGDNVAVIHVKSTFALDVVKQDCSMRQDEMFINCWWKREDALF